MTATGPATDAAVRRVLAALRAGSAPVRPSATEDEVRAWLNVEGEDLDEWDIQDWMNVGVRLPEQRPQGCEPVDIGMLNSLGIADRSPGWAGVADVCPDFVESGHGWRRSGWEIIAMFKAMNVPETYDFGRECRHRGGRRLGLLRDDYSCDYDREAVQAAINSLVEVRDVDWVAVALCLGAGMGIAEGAAYVRAGGDMEAVRVMAGLRA